MVSVLEGMRLSGARRHCCAAPDDPKSKSRWMNTDGSNRPAPYGPHMLIGMLCFFVVMITWSLLDGESAAKFMEVVFTNGLFKVLNIPFDVIDWLFRQFG
ncbi:MAG: hypothetical protein NBV67_13135 [Tagaea sp.]|nr:hypothetical protein [Tagaea sp.]